MNKSKNKDESVNVKMNSNTKNKNVKVNFDIKESNEKKDLDQENSGRNFNENDNTNYIKSKFESIINKYLALKNSLIKNNRQLILSFIFPKKYFFKSINEKVLTYFRKKLKEKLDIFYYFKQDRIKELMENIIMTKEQNQLKDLISRKNYFINLKKDNFEEKNNDNDDKNVKNKVLEYILSKREKVIEKSDQELLNNFLC